MKQKYRSSERFKLNRKTPEFLKKSALSRRNLRSKNIAAARAREKAYREKNPDKMREYQKRYALNGGKDRKVAYCREKREKNPLFAISHRIRRLVARGLEKRGFGKTSKTFDVLGCSGVEFAAHIERQFLPGMTWANRHLWHIDHIVSLATAKTESEVLALNHFSNLRPMWWIDNLKKGARQTHLI